MAAQDVILRDAMDPRPSPPADAAMPLFIVLNAASGHADAREVRQTIADVLNTAKREHVVLMAERGAAVAKVAAEAVALAKARGGAVVAAGGDGTINAVAQAVLGSGRPFGVVPQGTFNYFSRTHGIPSDTEAATRALLRASIRPAQVGLVNDRVFLVNASLGLYPRVLENREAHKKRFGRSRMVALGSALATLFSRHRTLHLRLSNATMDRNDAAQMLFVGNNALQIERIGAGGVSTDGRLAAILLAPIDTVGVLRLIAHSVIGKLDALPAVECFDFTEVEVLPRRRSRRGQVKVATDGEVTWLEAPLRFRVSPEPLQLLTPCDEDAVPPE